MTGYMKAKMNAKIKKYSKKMLHCLEVALVQINEEAGDEIAQNVDVAEFRQAAYELLAASAKLDLAHRLMSEKLQENGFRKIVSEDFVPMGVQSR